MLSASAFPIFVILTLIALYIIEENNKNKYL